MKKEINVKLDMDKLYGFKLASRTAHVSSPKIGKIVAPISPKIGGKVSAKVF